MQIGEELPVLRLVETVDAGGEHPEGRGVRRDGLEIIAVEPHRRLPVRPLRGLRLAAAERSERLRELVLAGLMVEMHDLPVVLAAVEEARQRRGIPLLLTGEELFRRLPRRRGVAFLAAGLIQAARRPYGHRIILRRAAVVGVLVTVGGFDAARGEDLLRPGEVLPRGAQRDR